MIDLRSPLPPLRRSERLVLWIVTLITALTRLWGLARSPWDWDEILFSLALRHYDVGLHRPHPPGFPLFIAVAHLFRALGLSDFHSLQAVNLVSGILLVPAMVFFCRELRLRFSTSLIAALVLAFFPNVWFFGETAFSDVPSMVLVVFACGLMLRGCRSDRAYFFGVVAIACSGAMRPQNLVIGLAPFLIATVIRRDFRLAVLSALAGAFIVIGSYGAAAAASGGWARYAETLRVHQEYITQTDSFRNPHRPPLIHLLDDFFVRPYRAPLINTIVTVLALVSLCVSLVKRRMPILIAVASFSPFCLIAWLILDHFSASRFSIGYAPMIAILAADGVELLAFRHERIEWAIGVAVTALMFFWTLPSIDLPRRSDSPPLQAVDWIRAHVKPGSAIFVHEGMGPFAEEFLDRYRVEWTLEGAPVVRLDSNPAWYVKEGRSTVAGSHYFAWPAEPIAEVARRRYLDSSVTPLIGVARFRDGWYDEEREGANVWRWMGSHAAIDLPAIDGPARLRLRIFVPLHVMRAAPAISLRMNGAVFESIVPKAAFTDVVHDFAGGPGSLTIETNQIVNPKREDLGEDPRDLGLRLDQLQWIDLEP